MAELNARPHTETRRAPAEMLSEERARMHPVPAEPYSAALGETRIVRDDQTVRFGAVPYSMPKAFVGKELFCRVSGEELVIVGRDRIRGLVEIDRHELSTPGHPRIKDEHYPDHAPGNGPKVRALKPNDDDERAFLALGDGAERWLREACSTGVSRIRTKMTKAVELAALVGAAPVDRALGIAALVGRFERVALAAWATRENASGVRSDLVALSTLVRSRRRARRTPHVGLVQLRPKLTIRARHRTADLLVQPVPSLIAGTRQ